MDLIAVIVGLMIVFFIVGAIRSKNKTNTLKEMGLYPDAKNATDEDVRRVLKQGYKIQAIKLYREIHNVDLKQAKEAVETLAGGRKNEN